MLAWQPPDSGGLSPRSQHGPTSPPVAPHHGGAGSMGGLTPLSATAMRVQHSPSPELQTWGLTPTQWSEVVGVGRTIYGNNHHYINVLETIATPKH